MRNALHKTMLLCCGLLLTGAVALGQGRGPGGGGGAPGGGGFGGPGGAGGGRPTFGDNGSNGNNTPNVRGSYPGDTSGSRGANGGGSPGLQLGPPGRWWDDKSFAKTLGLSKDQQKKMDTVFNANKGPILESYKAVQKQESALQALTREKKLDEAKIFAGIDAVAQARAALEKAKAHMLLLVRQEMDADQNARMEKYQGPLEE